MASAELKILMLGARRVGKTSLLAAIVNAFKDESLKTHLVIEDVTPDKNAQSTLDDKIKSVEGYLHDNSGRVMLLDEGATSVFHDYVISVSLPGDDGKMQMTFTDANGEFYVQGASKDFETVKQKIANYDIIVVAVDTPYLMEAVNANNPMCDPVLNEAYNQIDSIHTLLTSIDDNDGKNAKLVIFTPVKCELWAKRGEINKVTQRVEEVYDVTLTALRAFTNIEVLVLPVQTIGSIVFDSHKEAYQLTDARGESKKCTNKDDKGYVLLADGHRRKVRETDILQPDISAIIEGVGITRPNSWFKVVSGNYQPHNCEQLAYYILQFLLSKTLKAQEVEQEKKKEGRWWKTLLTGVALMAGSILSAAVMAAYWYLSERMGTIDIAKLQEALDKIRTLGLWKQDTEGIKIINKGLLNK